MERWREGWRGVVRQEKKRRKRVEEGKEEEEEGNREEQGEGDTFAKAEEAVSMGEEKMPGAFCSSSSGQLDW